MPLLLYIDTSGKTATVALSGKDGLLAVRTHHHAQEQAALLNGMIAEVLSGQGLSLADTEGICVCAGPGSYTGLRVGLSTGKGLAYALDKPLLLFNNLDLLAKTYQDKDALAVALKARVGEYFYACYDAAGNQVHAPQHIFEQDIPDPAAAGDLLITDAVELYPAAARIAVDPEQGVDIASWITMAGARFAAGLFDDLAYAEPFYLKAAYTTQSKK